MQVSPLGEAGLRRRVGGWRTQTEVLVVNSIKEPPDLLGTRGLTARDSHSSPTGPLDGLLDLENWAWCCTEARKPSSPTSVMRFPGRGGGPTAPVTPPHQPPGPALPSPYPSLPFLHLPCPRPLPPFSHPNLSLHLFPPLLLPLPASILPPQPLPPPLPPLSFSSSSPPPFSHPVPCLHSTCQAQGPTSHPKPCAGGALPS